MHKKPITTPVWDRSQDTRPDIFTESKSWVKGGRIKEGGILLYIFAYANLDWILVQRKSSISHLGVNWESLHMD